MPYARKYKRTARGRRFFRRREATQTIQRAWRRRQRRRRGGLVARTALANRKSIKRINRKIETKYVTSQICRTENNYTGQQLYLTGVDAAGMANQLVGVDPQNPTSGTPNPTWNSESVCMRPICVANGIGEQQRIGEDIHMAWLNIKGFVSSFPAECNGVNPHTTVDWSEKPQAQRVRMVVVLDTQPIPWKTNAVPGTPGTYQKSKNPGYLYNNFGVMTNYPSFNAGYESKNLEYLRGGAKAPFGSMGGDTSVDFWSQSYYENNYVQSTHGNKDARFKVLKTLNLEIGQPSQGTWARVPNLPSRRNFSVTIKAPYRFHFKDNDSTTPCNQEILIFFVSDTKVKSPSSATDPTPIVATPKVTCQCKLAFKDP